MAYENRNHLIKQYENAYYERDFHDEEVGRTHNEWGNYQFVAIQTIIDQFIINYVGRDKIIPAANKLDVQYHAMRGLQEFSYDIIKSHKGFEFTLTPSLQMILPQDYVNYTQISWSDGSGIKHPIYPTSDTSNPFKPYQTSDTNALNQFSIQAVGTTTVGSNFIQLDDLYPHIPTGGILSGRYPTITWANEDFFGQSPIGGRLKLIIKGVYHDKATSKTWIEVYNHAGAAVNALIAGDTHIELRLFDTWGDGYNLVSWPEPVVVYNPTFTATSNRITAAAPGDVANIKKGMIGTASHHHFNYSNSRVIDVDYTNGYIYHDYPQFSTSNIAPPNNTAGWTQLPSISYFDDHFLQPYTSTENRGPHLNNLSDTKKNHENIEGGDVLDSRYGLDPSRANVNGTFYIEDHIGLIRFSSDLAGKTIVLDYISDSVGTAREQVVHKLAEEALYKWIAYGIIASRSGSPEFLVNRFKKERFAEMRKAKLRLSNFKPKELTKLLRGKSKQIKH